MGTVLYNLIIFPLTQLLEFFYVLFFEITKNKGISVIGLSFVVSLCTLPLYMIAEQWQEIEREKQSQMKKGIDRIKTTFKGDEQYMILSTFYKQNHYHPLMALRSSFSLLIQIPFFIAAYHFLSNLTALRGDSFLFIKDFGTPDATFHIGSFNVNILPIAMTIINCISGAIYSKGHDIKEKIQIYGCAAVFLVLLYDSPAGLVVYWTMNNIISMVKNVFYKMKNPKKILYIIVCIFSFIIVIFSLFFTAHTKKIVKLFLIFTGIVLPLIPFVIKFVYLFIKNHFEILDEKPKLRLWLFISIAVTLSTLTGLFIPTTLVSSEPGNYCYIENYSSPSIFIITPFFQALGFCLLWPGCFYALFSNTIKKIIVFFSTILSIAALINTFAFSENYGPINPNLLFMDTQNFFPSKIGLVLNFIAISVITVLFLYFLNKKKLFQHQVFTILFCSLLIVSCVNCVRINKAYKNIIPENTQKELKPIYHLSKENKNVMIFMLDRCVTSIVSRMLDNKQELYSQLEGFTFYPNTVTLGYYTLTGSPGLFGGYDYTPFISNKNKDKTIQQKHNEALLTMPVLFNSVGYETTVSNLPYENFFEYPLSNMYIDYPYVNRINTNGNYSEIWYEKNNIQKNDVLSNQIKRNFIWFSLFKCVSPIFRKIIYHNNYWMSDDIESSFPNFIDKYSALTFLPELTDSNSQNPTLTIIGNEATHDPIVTQAPEYIPAEKIDFTDFSELQKDPEFSATNAVFNQLINFFNYLKENNLYDNTRIILVSDHGAEKSFPEFDDSNTNYYKARTTATLLVKDFNAKGNLIIDDSFMTNADTPSIAVDQIIEDAVNPFTGNLLKPLNKNDYIKICISAGEKTNNRYHTNYTIKDSEWVTVHNNIYEKSNWSKLYEEK